MLFFFLRIYSQSGEFLYTCIWWQWHINISLTMIDWLHELHLIHSQKV